mgnify:FL=1
MKETIGEGVQEVRFTHRLKNHPVCLTSEGALSVEMEKVINSMPNDQKVKAQTALEINDSHPIAQKIKDLYANDKEELKKYPAKVFEVLGGDITADLVPLSKEDYLEIFENAYC